MKRFCCLLLCLVFVFSLASCEGTEIISTEEKVVAVEYGLADSINGESFIADGFSVVEYNSSSDVVLAVENGKADLGVVDDFQLNSYIAAGRKIKKKALCEYQIDYCVYFNSENEALQEEFNKAIDNLSNNGTLEEIKSKNLKSVVYQQTELIKSDKNLVMLCDPSFPGRIYMSNNNEIVGMDVDVAKAICNTLGYELKIKTADFDDLFTMLQEGEGDFLISATQVSDIRAEQFLLSDTYLTLNYHLIEKE